MKRMSSFTNLFIFSKVLLEITKPVVGLQVRFNNMSSVVRVGTQVGTACPACIITQYRLSFSEDCTTFHNIVDGAGNNMVLTMLIDVVVLQYNQNVCTSYL